MQMMSGVSTSDNTFDAKRYSSAKPVRFSIDCIEDLPRKLSNQKFSHIVQKFLSLPNPREDSAGLLELFEDFFIQVSEVLQ